MTIAEHYTRANTAQRERIVGRLLAPIGPLARAVLAGGAFAHAAGRNARKAHLLPPADVHELARYVEQSDPAACGAIVHELGQALREASPPAPPLAARRDAGAT